MYERDVFGSRDILLNESIVGSELHDELRFYSSKQCNDEPSESFNGEENSEFFLLVDLDDMRNIKPIYSNNSLDLECENIVHPQSELFNGEENSEFLPLVDLDDMRNIKPVYSNNSLDLETENIIHGQSVRINTTQSIDSIVFKKPIGRALISKKSRDKKISQNNRYEKYKKDQHAIEIINQSCLSNKAKNRILKRLNKHKSLSLLYHLNNISDV